MADFELGPNHVPGIRVPKGGSSCSSCKFLAENQKDCTNEFFQKWHGSEVIPAPIDEYCSDWYEPRKSAVRRAMERTNAV